MNNFIAKNNYNLLIIFISSFILTISFCIKLNNDYSFNIVGIEKFNFKSFCLYEEITGTSCPTCGLTKSIVSVSHFNFIDAITFNRAGILIYLLFVLQIPYRIGLIFKKPGLFNNKIIKSFSKIYIYLVLFMLLTEWTNRNLF